jgi:hypothetical protein
MPELSDQIPQLNDQEAVQAAAYLAKCLQAAVQAQGGAPVQLDDGQAATMLSKAFSGLSSELDQIRPDGDAALRGQAARNLLSLCAEDPDLTQYVQDSLDQLAFKFEPFTMMAIAAGIVFLMQLKFNVKYHSDKLNVEVGKKATTEATIKKVLTFGNPLKVAGKTV